MKGSNEIQFEHQQSEATAHARHDWIMVSKWDIMKAMGYTDVNEFNTWYDKKFGIKGQYLSAVASINRLGEIRPLYMDKGQVLSARPIGLQMVGETVALNITKLFVERAVTRFALRKIATGLVESVGRAAEPGGGKGYRYMTCGEIDAIKKTGYLRGGRPGETYFTKDLYKSSFKAQSRLSLPFKPAYRVEFKILNDPAIIKNGTKVLPDYGQIGKGAEFMTIDPVQVNIINIQPLR